MALADGSGAAGWSRISGAGLTGSDLTDDGVLEDMRTWLARRPGHGLDLLDSD